MDENNKIIEHFARRIVRFGLETPATIFLELHKPISSLFYHSSVFFQPLAAPLFGLERYSNIQKIISSTENIDKLITLIEAISTEKQKNQL